MEHIEIQYRLKKINRSQKYLSRIFKVPESHISRAIRGNELPTLLKKIIKHIKKLEAHK
jgi:hypothetical protein